MKNVLLLRFPDLLARHMDLDLCQANDVCKTYSLGRLISYRKLGSFTNSVYLLHASRGLFVLKFYLYAGSLEHLAPISDVLTFLRERCFPADYFLVPPFVLGEP